MSDIGKIGGAIGAATAINTSYQISKGVDPVPSLVAAGIFFGLLAGAGSLFGDGGKRVAKYFAYLILLAVVLGRGYPLLQSITKLTAGLTVTPTKTNPIPASPTR
jgi:hypothetical protein